jgi:hypothetical protein
VNQWWYNSRSELVIVCAMLLNWRTKTVCLRYIPVDTFLCAWIYWKTLFHFIFLVRATALYTSYFRGNKTDTVPILSDSTYVFVDEQSLIRCLRRNIFCYRCVYKHLLRRSVHGHTLIMFLEKYMRLHSIIPYMCSLIFARKTYTTRVRPYGHNIVCSVCFERFFFFHSSPTVSVPSYCPPHSLTHVQYVGNRHDNSEPFGFRSHFTCSTGLHRYNINYILCKARSYVAEFYGGVYFLYVFK